MNIIIHGNISSKKIKFFIKKLLRELIDKYKFTIFISKIFFKFLKKINVNLSKLKVFKKKNILKYNLIISIGGDGTLLESIKYIKKIKIPIIGINTGRLGFLSIISKKNIFKFLKKYFNNKYIIENKILIKMNIDKKKNSYFALNEIAIVKNYISSMIKINIFINELFFNSYWSDGLIVSTPTGSTGYSLSCGGPVVVFQCNNLIITPISSHNLFIRSIVIPDKSIINFKIESRNKKFLISFDSQSKFLNVNQSIKISKEKNFIKFIKDKPLNIFDSLRKKLNWGLDNRNKK